MRHIVIPSWCYQHYQNSVQLDIHFYFLFFPRFTIIDIEPSIIMDGEIATMIITLIWKRALTSNDKDVKPMQLAMSTSKIFVSVGKGNVTIISLELETSRNNILQQVIENQSMVINSMSNCHVIEFYTHLSEFVPPSRESYLTRKIVWYQPIHTHKQVKLELSVVWFSLWQIRIVENRTSIID